MELRQGRCCRTVDMHIRVGPLPDTRNLLQSKRITRPGNHHIAYPAAQKNSVAGDVVVRGSDPLLAFIDSSVADYGLHGV